MCDMGESWTVLACWFLNLLYLLAQKISRCQNLSLTSLYWPEIIYITYINIHMFMCIACFKWRRREEGKEGWGETRWQRRAKALHSLSYEYWRGWFSLLYVSPTPSCPSPPQTQRPRACTHPDPAAPATSPRRRTRKSRGGFESGVKRERLLEESWSKIHQSLPDEPEACMTANSFLFWMQDPIKPKTSSRLYLQRLSHDLTAVLPTFQFNVSTDCGSIC